MWLLDRDDDGADGAEEAAASTSNDASSKRTTEGTETAGTVDDLALDESIYLSGDGTEQPNVVVDAAVPPAPQGEVVSALATFSSNFNRAGLCVGGPGEVGGRLTVTNVNNDRETDCVSVSGNGIIVPEPGTIVLDRATYLEIADASDAPVPVELRR